MIWSLKLRLRFYITQSCFINDEVEEWGGEEGDIVCNEFG